MRNVIFTDIDGVLNSMKTFKKNNLKRLFYGRLSNLSSELLMKSHMAHIDYEKLELLKRLAFSTDSEIVVISAWKNLNWWPLVEEELVRLGLPIVGTLGCEFSRFEEIDRWLMLNFYEDFLVIDDDFFDGYENIIDNILRPSFYDDGLTLELVEEGIRRLRKLKPLEKRLQLDADAYTIGSDPFTK